MQLTGKCLLLLFAASICGCDDGFVGPIPIDEINAPPVPESVVAWLKGNVIPIPSATPTGSFADLEPLKELIGDARVVALGEATHGSREFFLMKHRLVRFLVQEMGFNVFAMEASMPESVRIDRYVNGGPGDPAELLSGLYFWTWNTQEVLDMIAWMRAHNAAPGGAPTVSFTGFDMQFPGMAVANTEAFFQEHAPDSAAWAASRFDCMREYLNGPDGQAPRDRWLIEPIPERDDCRASVEEVEAFLELNRSQLEERATLERFEQAAQDVRLVLQWEAKESLRFDGDRDQLMAENLLWLLDQAGPDAKVIMWAHNLHVSYLENWQGDLLQDALGDDYLSIGLTFGRGSFNAITRLLNGDFRGIETQQVGSPPSGSYEYRFTAAEIPFFALDLRSLSLSPGEDDWLAVPLWFRSVGSVYEPEDPGLYFLRNDPLPDMFDAVVYVDASAESTLLPFRMPSQF